MSDKRPDLGPQRSQSFNESGSEHPPSAGERSASNRASVWSIILLMLGGVCRQILDCASASEIGNVKGRGLMLLGSTSFTALGFGVIAHTLYGDGRFSFGLTALAIGLAVFVGVTDSCVLYRYPQHRLGLSELAKGGLRLPATHNYSSKIIVGLRIAQSLTTGSLVGLFLSLTAYSTDIRARIDADYLADNRLIVERVGPLYDAAVARATDAIKDETSVTRALDKEIAALQQNEVRKALRAARRAGSKMAADTSSSTQLAALEQKRLDENARLDHLKTDGASLMEGRNAAVQKAIDSAPNHKPKRDGILGRLMALDALLTENPKLLFIVLAIDFVALGIDLAPLFAKSIYVPSKYAAVIALEHLQETAALARQGAVTLHQIMHPADSAERSQVDPAEDAATETDASARKPEHEDEFAITPMKRKRGRPPKSSYANGSTSPTPQSVQSTIHLATKEGVEP